MKKTVKSVSTLIVTIVLILLIFSGQSSIGRTKIDSFFNNIQTDYIILISDNSQVIEVNNSDAIVWQYEIGCVDSEKLANGNNLLTQGFLVNEINGLGIIIWQYGVGLLGVSDVERLDNGNTLITDMINNKVVEVNNTGYTIWQYNNNLSLPMDAERLANGNTLIVNNFRNSVIEINQNGSIVWEYSSGLWSPTDVERLPNGNTLITDYLNNRVIELNCSNDIIWQKTNLKSPKDAERLSNGNTLIAEYANNQIIEVNKTGEIIWSYKGSLFQPNDVEIIANNPPNTPNITGPSKGYINVPYIFKFRGEDPGGHTIYYWIDWGDGQIDEWIGPFLSGLPIPRTHKWTTEGSYTIKAKIKDVCDVESNFGSITVKMPREKTIDLSFLRSLNNLEIFDQILYKIFQQLSLLDF